MGRKLAGKSVDFQLKKNLNCKNTKKSQLKSIFSPITLVVFFQLKTKG